MDLSFKDLCGNNVYNQIHCFQVQLTWYWNSWLLCFFVQTKDPSMDFENHRFEPGNHLGITLMHVTRQ